MLKLPFIPAKSKAIMIKNFGRRMLGKDFPPYELEFKAKGGKIIVGRIIGTLIKDSKGKKIADLIMISDVTEQAKYEDALRQSKHDLEVAMRRLGKTNKELMHQSNMRQEFINTVVHELKTPLTPVRGYLEMLLGEDLGELNPKQKDALEVISRSINLSKNLIEDLSGLSKAEAVKSKVTKKRTDLLDIINFVAKEMKSFALEKKITLVAELPKSLPVVNADRGQMEQLLTNLIHNAIKFTPEQGFVGVSAARQGKNIVVSIRDTGIGISKADQKKLFTKFFRAKSARDEGEGGTGLGLSICKRIIEVHNGKIGVKSTLGRGTTFTFTIPAMG
ncbi:HAMP domain-containing histidine kinase, partial [Candidatus Micrarchaeota archaeon]|nr:HAMP domain-containing histidine kinase [Candidatus Micrarchaeota archaeon]MBU1939202.1 HAMP domain-containing histidine kinase [Candidatus Micrarchaeota archaeon]